MHKYSEICKLLFFPLLFGGCDITGEIFRTGFLPGIVIIVAVLAVIVFIVKLLIK